MEEMPTEAMNLVMVLMTMDMAVIVLLVDLELLELVLADLEHHREDQDHLLEDLIPLQEDRDHQDQDQEEDQTLDLDHLQDQDPHAQVQDNVPQHDLLKTTTVMTITDLITADLHAQEDMEDLHLTQVAIPHTPAAMAHPAATEVTHLTITLITKTLTTDMTAHTPLHITLTPLTPQDLNWYPTKVP